VCSRELAAWAEHALLGDLSRLQEDVGGIVSANALAVLRRYSCALGAGWRL
jgi:hypothetical protein